MKLYIWKNSRSDSDFMDIDSMHADHSACLVIVAESKERAIEIATYDYPNEKLGEVFECEINKEGVIIYADGEC